MKSIPLAASTLVLLCAVSWGQAKKPAAFGPALRRAVSTGAITSGTAYFKSSRNGAVVAVKTVVLPAQAGVRLSVHRHELFAMRVEQTVFGCTIDLDGRARAIRFDYVRGRQRAKIRGRVEGKLLKLTGPQARVLPWKPAWVPFSAAAFLLPRLTGQKLPLLKPILFHEGSQTANSKPSSFDRLRTSIALRKVWEDPLLRDQQVLISLGSKGALGRIKLGPETLTPIKAATAKRLVPALESGE